MLGWASAAIDNVRPNRLIRVRELRFAATYQFDIVNNVPRSDWSLSQREPPEAR